MDTDLYHISNKPMKAYMKSPRAIPIPVIIPAFRPLFKVRCNTIIKFGPGLAKPITKMPKAINNDWMVSIYSIESK